jgi:hypothetical protein
MMSQIVDVFVIGDRSNSSAVIHEPEWQVSLRLLPTGLATAAEFAQSPFATQLVEGEGDLVALTPAGGATAIRAVGRMADFLASDPPDLHRTAAFVIHRIDPLLVQDPTAANRPFAGIVALIAPRATHGPAVFRRSKLRELGSLRNVGEPVWDWLIRAALAGRNIVCLGSGEDRPLDTGRLPLLAPRRPNDDMNWLLEYLNAVRPGQWDFHPATKVDETALRAGLFQWHDFLDESHQCSQSIEGEGENQLGDYWHAIMHRREPDYSNAKYWFRQFGDQPTYRELRSIADGILANSPAPDAPCWRDRLQAGSKWNPLAFVDLCEECAADEQSDLAIAARRIQYAEMSLLV